MFKTIRFALSVLFLFFLACSKNKYNSRDNLTIKSLHLDFSNINRSREEYLDSLKAVLDTRKNDSVTRRYYLELASEYYSANIFKKSLQLSIHAKMLSELAGDKAGLAQSCFYIGDCYETVRKDSAYFYYLKAQRLYARIGDYENVGRMFYNKAYILFYEGNYAECESELAKSLNLLRKSDNHHLLYSCFTLMGNCMEKFNNYDDALSYHKLAVKRIGIIASDSTQKDLAASYNISSILNICNIYDLKEQHSKSIPILRNLLTPSLKEREPNLYANVLSNLACSLMSAKDTSNVGSMLSESLRIAEKNGSDSDVLYKKNHIGEYFLLAKDCRRATAVLTDANHHAVRIKNGNEILTTLKLLIKADRRNRLHYITEFIKISDSLNAVQKNSHTKYARIEYETSSIINENKNLVQANFRILLYSFAVFVLLALLIVHRHLAYKSAQLQYLKKEQKANEEIYELLTQESEKINTAKNMEKVAIGRELHDGILSRIYGIRMNLGGLNSKTDQKIIELRKKYIVELQHVENDIRDISHDLCANSLFEENDFDLLLRNLIDNQKTLTDTVFHYIADKEADWASINITIKVNIYRIIQEGIFNAVKHSKALNCIIRIALNCGHLEISISDDGIGYNAGELKKGIGLSNMQTRVKAMHGSFKIKSALGLGTEIKISIEPVP